MTVLRAFGRFWYDFIIGDDWKIAAAVVLAVALTVGIQATRLLGDEGLAVVGGAVILAAFVVSLTLDVRSRRR